MEQLYQQPRCIVGPPGMRGHTPPVSVHAARSDWRGGGGHGEIKRGGYAGSYHRDRPINVPATSWIFISLVTITNDMTSHSIDS